MSYGSKRVQTFTFALDPTLWKEQRSCIIGSIHLIGGRAPDHDLVAAGRADCLLGSPTCCVFNPELVL